VTAAGADVGTYGYTLAGQVRRRVALGTNGEPAETELTGYDARGRVVNEELAVATDPAQTISRSYGYGPDDRLERIAMSSNLAGENWNDQLLPLI